MKYTEADKKTKLSPALILGALFVSLYLIYGIANLKNVILNGDCGLNAYPAINIIKSADLDLESEVYMDRAQRIFPTNMCMPYAFYLPGYLLLPFFSLLGISPYTISLMPVFAGALYLIFLFLFLKNYLKESIAFYTVSLLSLSPAYIFFTQNAHVSTEPFIDLIVVISLFLFAMHLKTKKILLLLASAAFLGSGLSIKLSVFSRYAALTAVLLFIYFKESISYIRSLRLIEIILVSGSFLAGGSLFFAYNINTGAKSFKQARYILQASETPEGVNNRDIITNFNARLLQLKTILLDYNYVRYPEHVDRNSRKFKDDYKYNLVRIYICVYIFALLAALIDIKRNKSFSKKVFSIYLYFSVVLMLSIFTPFSLNEYQMTCMFSFVEIIIAISLYYLIKMCMTLPYMIKRTAIAASFLLLYIYPVSIEAELAVFYWIYADDFVSVPFMNSNLVKLASNIKDMDLKKVYVVNNELSKIGSFITAADTDFKKIDPSDGNPLQTGRRNKYFRRLNKIFDKNNRIYVLIMASKSSEILRLGWIKEYSLEHRISFIKVSSIYNEHGLVIYDLYEFKKR